MKSTKLTQEQINKIFAVEDYSEIMDFLTEREHRECKEFCDDDKVLQIFENKACKRFVKHMIKEEGADYFEYLSLNKE